VILPIDANVVVDMEINIAAEGGGGPTISKTSYEPINMYRQTNDLIREPALLFTTIIQRMTDNATVFMFIYVDTVRNVWNVCCM